MMYHANGPNRYKWKEKALAALYLTFVLATVGEFFYALNSLEHKVHKEGEVHKEIEIPPHIPEESKLEFIRIHRIKKLN